MSYFKLRTPLQAKQNARYFSWCFLSAIEENKANLMLAGKEVKLTPTENGGIKNELVAGDSLTSSIKWLPGRYYPLLGVISFFFKFQGQVFIDWIKQSIWGRLVSVFQEGEMVLWTSNYWERGIFGNLSLCQPQSIFTPEYIFMIIDSPEQLVVNDKIFVIMQSWVSVDLIY